LLFIEDHEAELFASFKTIKEANDSGLLSTVTGFDQVVPAADGSGIVAVQSKIEFLSFDEPLVTEGKSVLQWASELEGRVISSMRKHLTEAWNKYSHADLMTLADKFPSQISCLTLNLRFTEECEKALSRGNLKKLKSALESLERTIGSACRAMRKEMNDFVRMRLKNLQLVALGYRRRMIRLVKAIESGSSFQDTWALWRSFLRAYYDESEANLVTMECGESEVPYGFHFDGSLLLVETDESHRAYCKTMGTLAAKGTRTFVAWGPAGTGKTETQKTLVTSLGYRSVVYSCKSKIIADSFDRLVGAAKANPRCVMIFDEVNRAGSPQEIVRYLSAVQRISREERPLFQSYTFNPHNKNCDLSLDQILSTGATSLPMIRPEVRVISQAMLCNEGFVYHDKLGTLAATYYEWCKEKLSKQPHYDFGLRNIKASFSTAGYYLRKTFNPDCTCEIQCVLDSVRLNTMARMNDADQALAEAKLNKLFEDCDARSWESQLNDAKQREFAASVADQAVRNRLCQLLTTQEIRHGVCTLTENCGVTFKGLQDCAGALDYNFCHLDVSGGKFTVDHVLGKFVGHPQTEAKEDNSSESWEDVSRGTWTDGVLAAAMRAAPKGKRTWIVLTGAECTKENCRGKGLWQAFYTLLDDNRVLCLPNGERVALHRDARIVFVLSNLSNATPALVSRMGVVNFGVQPNGACALM